MGINRLSNQKIPILLTNLRLTTIEENLVLIDNLNLNC